MDVISRQNRLLVENAECEGKRQRVAELTAFLNEQVIRRLIKKVTVQDSRFESNLV